MIAARTLALKALELDFRRQGPASPWGGWVLLALAALFAGDLGHSYHAARQAVAATEARLAQQARARGAAAPAAASRRAVTPEELALARETIQRLQMPWDPLFGALEAAASDKILLTAVEPDTKSGTVLISGEANSYPAALDYVVQLREGGTLRSAHLVRHEQRPNDARRPVGFAVSASWSEVQR
jgi:hypothetical protein